MNTQPDVKTLIIVFAVVLVLIASVAVVLAVYRNRLRAENAIKQRLSAHQERFRNAVWASAVVVAATSVPSSKEAGDKVQVKLWLEVEPPEGERYPAKPTWWVNPDSLGLLRPGDSVAVKIDAIDGMRIYPNVDWAEPVEWEGE